MTSWEVVERYARWRRTMRWRDLPDDVVGTIISFLGETDVDSLVRALVDDPQANGLSIHPMELRTLWAQDEVIRSFRAFVASRLADQVLYDTRSPATSTVLLFDWSCFSVNPPQAVVEFSWHAKRALVDIHRDRLLDEARRRAHAQLPVARVTLHRVFESGGRCFMEPEPTMVSECSVVPAGLVGCLVGR